MSWPAFGDVTGEGLELVPDQAGEIGAMIVIPDADQTPEQLVGLVPGVPPESQVARRLAENGFRVVVPTLIDRTVARRAEAQLTGREFIYRSAFELGRHVIGYEVQKVMSVVDMLSRGRIEPKIKIGVFGYGEGGAIALYAAALDPRIDAVCVSGYFDDRNDVWRQPVDRNIFGVLEQFGDAQVGSLVTPRALIVEAAHGPEAVIGRETRGAPGRLTTPKVEAVKAEVDKLRKLVTGLYPKPTIDFVVSGPDGTGPFGTEEALNKLSPRLTDYSSSRDGRANGHAAPDPVADAGPDFEQLTNGPSAATAKPARSTSSTATTSSSCTTARTSAASSGRSSTFRRWQRLRRRSSRSATFFANDFVGRFELALLPPNVRSRRIFDEAKFTGYEVVMDVFPDVIAYGILLVPKGIKDGEKRPVVVCQHGLGGRPRDVSDPKIDNRYYHRFGVRLAELGFITFAPQNLYIFGERFRTLQRKANPIHKTLYSVQIPQHQQITEWLKTLPQVQPDRIGFYGLSYGGKSAMHIPPLVKNYSLSICSADFNDCIWKNASSTSPYSFVGSEEYEIFEFDLGSTFNYAEMAALIAPRPFMVERGHFDGVAPDETVAYEFAKVFYLYDAKLGIGDRCAIEYFTGGHTINGKGTFAFLQKHLK